MKLGLLLFTFIISSALPAQVIEIKVKKIQPYTIYKKTSGAQVLKNEQWVGKIENKTAFFVVDLNSKECKYIENGEETSVTKITRIKQKGSFIRISLKEFDDGLPIYIFHKSLDIYTDAGVVYFTSYNRLYRSTRVELATEAEVVIKDCAYITE